jgi:hypothetical protein
VFDRSDPRTTTAPQPSTIMKPVRTRWKGSGPVFNGSVDSWVALANPVPRVQRESAFHKPQDWFGPGISLDPRSSNFPCWRDRRRVRPASRPVKGFEPSVPLTWSAIPLEGRARDLTMCTRKSGLQKTPRWRGTDSNFRFPERSVKRQGRARGRSRILFLVRLSPVRLSGNCLCWHQTRKT